MDGSRVAASGLVHHQSLLLQHCRRTEVSSQFFFLGCPRSLTVAAVACCCLRARSGILVKSTAAEQPCAGKAGCSGHGECDADTNGACVCRFGWMGQECQVAPAGITTLTGSIK